MKIPKSLGAAADLLYTLQQQRLEKSKEVDELKEQEKALEEHILFNMLPEAKLNGARGNIGQVSIKQSTQANVIDWDKFYTYIGKHKAWAMLQQRPSVTALREVWDNGMVIPGVEPMVVSKLHVSKVGTK